MGVHMKRIKLVSAFVVIGGLTISSCSPGESIAEQILEGQEGITDVEIDEEDGTVKIEGEDGDSSFSIGGGELPEGFPIDVMAGGSVEAVFEQLSGDTVSLTYTTGYDDMAGFYQNWVSKSGFEETYKLESSDPKQINWGLADGNLFYGITVAEDLSGGATVILIVSEA